MFLPLSTQLTRAKFTIANLKHQPCSKTHLLLTYMYYSKLDVYYSKIWLVGPLPMSVKRKTIFKGSHNYIFSSEKLNVLVKFQSHL